MSAAYLMGYILGTAQLRKNDMFNLAYFLGLLVNIWSQLQAYPACQEGHSGDTMFKNIKYILNGIITTETQ